MMIVVRLQADRSYLPVYHSPESYPALPVLNADKATQVTGKIPDHFTFVGNVGAPGSVLFPQRLLAAKDIAAINKMIVGSRSFRVRLRSLLHIQKLPFSPYGGIPYGSFEKRLSHVPQMTGQNGLISTVSGGIIQWYHFF